MFGVRWLDPAMDELAAIFAPAEPAERDRIMAAVRIIDGTLRTEGPTAGESRPWDCRVVLSPPLGVQFMMDASGTLARIERVWWYDRRRR
jgi:hypothetical protein